MIDGSTKTQPTLFVVFKEWEKFYFQKSKFYKRSVYIDTLFRNHH